MKITSPLRSLNRVVRCLGKTPNVFLRITNTVPPACNAYSYSRDYKDSIHNGRDCGSAPTNSPTNPLWEYFQSHKTGHGIWKWEHYFEIYHRHFARFVGQKVNVLEVGVYAGGSLEMWRSYFGEQSHVFGVDIDEACKQYESNGITIFVGDQADRRFWDVVKKCVDGFDILIDDGGHTPEQQQITLEEMLPALRPGGVYLCEDVHGSFNRFAGFATGLAHQLNGFDEIPNSVPLESRVTDFQAAVHSLHFYPFTLVIEKHRASPKNFSSFKRGTEWPPAS